MIFSQKKPLYFGLDISDTSLKIVATTEKRNQFQLVNYGQINLPEGYFDDGKIVKPDEIANQLSSLIANITGPKLKTKFIHACLPDNQTFIKLITIPKMTDEEVPQAVEWAVEHNLPFTLDEIYLDWQIIHRRNNKFTILIGASPKEIVDSYTELLKKCSLTPLSLEVEALAIVRALLDPENNSTEKESIGIVDLGAIRSNLILYGNGAVHSIFGLPLSGNNITKTVSEKLSLDPVQAENAKILCGLDETKCQGGLKVILEDAVKELIEKIKTSLEFYQENEEHSLPVKHLLLTGGGANLAGITEILSKELKIETTRGNPARWITMDKNINLSEESVQSYATAIGLAIKEM